MHRSILYLAGANQFYLDAACSQLYNSLGKLECFFRSAIDPYFFRTSPMWNLTAMASPLLRTHLFRVVVIESREQYQVSPQLTLVPLDIPTFWDQCPRGSNKCCHDCVPAAGAAVFALPWGSRLLRRSDRVTLQTFKKRCPLTSHVGMAHRALHRLVSSRSFAASRARPDPAQACAECKEEGCTPGRAAGPECQVHPIPIYLYFRGCL